MPAKLAAALGLIALAGAIAAVATGPASAAPRTLATEIVGQNALTLQTDDTTHQGTLLVNNQPVIQNPNGAVGVDGLFPTPDKTYILADLGETSSCYHYEIVTITGQQSTVSPQFGNCDYASAYLVKDVLHVSFRSMAATAKLKASGTQAFDGRTLR
jgi:hypothetical protein